MTTTYKVSDNSCYINKGQSMTKDQATEAFNAYPNHNGFGAAKTIKLIQFTATTTGNVNTFVTKEIAHKLAPLF